MVLHMMLWIALHVGLWMEAGVDALAESTSRLRFAYVSMAVWMEVKAVACMTRRACAHASQTSAAMQSCGWRRGWM